jgi:hypothetical protein
MRPRFLHPAHTGAAKAVLAASSAVLFLVAAHPGLAQETQPRIAVQGVALSADTVLLGDRFSLTVTLRLTESSVAFLPDSILGRGFEPFGDVEWEAQAVGGGVEVAATYPLIAFEVGDVEIPDFEVYAADATEGLRAGMVDEGRSVGRFDTFVENVQLLPSARLTSVPPTRIAVVSVLHAEDMEYGIAPRPVADVAGGDRNWPATLLTVFFGIALLGVTGVSAREWAAARVRPGEPPPSAKDVALSELDALLAEELAADHTRDFYIRTSGIARRFVESFEARWGPSWTGTELMDGLAAYAAGPASQGDAPPPLPSTAPMRDEVAAAERVKFGGVRPDADEAEGHAHRLRRWIEAVPDEPGSDG